PARGADPGRERERPRDPALGPGRAPGAPGRAVTGGPGGREGGWDTPGGLRPPNGTKAPPSLDPSCRRVGPKGRTSGGRRIVIGPAVAISTLTRRAIEGGRPVDDRRGDGLVGGCRRRPAGHSFVRRS